MRADNSYSFERIQGVPLYQQIKDMLRVEVMEMPLGEQIPSEPQLMRRYGVSRGPVRQAITELVYEGFLYRMQGRGTFRAGATINYSRYTVHSLTDQLVCSGMEPGIRDVTLESVIAPANVARQLQLNGATEVWKLSRIRTADEEPITYSRGFILKEMIPELSVDDLEMSIMKMLKEKFAMNLPISQSLCSASTADQFLANKLNVNPGDAIYHIEFVCTNELGRRVFMDISDSVGRKYVMRIEQL